MPSGSEKNILGEIYNVGTGRDVSLTELVEIINKILGKNVRAKYVEMPVKNYIATQLGDISKITREFNYQPAYSLEDGIKYIISHDISILQSV